MRISGGGSVRARCADTFYRGDHWLHSVEIEDVPVTVLVRGDRPVKPGERVALEVDRPAFAADDGDEGA